MRSRLVLWSLVPLAASLAQAETPVWEGYMASASGARFALSERQTKASAWIEVGDSFAGYTLEAFDKDQERIVLRRGAETVQLSLKADAVVSGKGAAMHAGGRGLPYAAGGARRWASDRPKAKAAKESFNAGKLSEAARLAREILAGDRSPNDNGGPFHDAHMVLGRIAVREGRVDEAVASLLAAARGNRGDPGMDSFGPNMSLAKDLLEQGRQEAVLQYFELCRGFWKHGPKRLDQWTAAIKAGTPPDFGPNLHY